MSEKLITNFFIIIFTEIDRKLIDLNLEPLLVEKSDFDCVLCCRTLWKPVTTPCGHSYCLVCLDRSLDYSSSCPLCMKSLADVSDLLNQFALQSVVIGIRATNLISST